MSSSAVRNPVTLPLLTADRPGVGGVIKRHNEDFVVTEVALYQPCGDGTHTYFTIEKRGRTTLHAIQMIAKALGKPRHDIGFAGLKDAHGLTRQTLSVEHVDPARIEALSIDGVRVLSVARHTNKLKLGHLAGNSFDVKIRDTVSSPLPLAQAILDRLTTRGMPNYFGPQRFGVRGDNADIGRAILSDDYDEAIALILGRPGRYDNGDVRKARELFEAGDLRAAALAWPGPFQEQIRICLALLRSGGDARLAWRAVDHSLRKLYVSAFQSGLFNRVLAARIGDLDRVETGDIAWKHVNGACFHVQDAAIEQPRCEVFEISPTGPIFGPRMTEPSGAPARIELQVLIDAGASRDQLRAKYLTKLRGGRRPLRVPIKGSAGDKGPILETGTDEHGSYLRLCFHLPPGAYATSITRELCKTTEQP